jgi:hypothetical protein
MNTIAHLLIKKTSKQGILLSIIIFLFGMILLRERMNTIGYTLAQIFIIYYYFHVLSDSSSRLAFLSPNKFVYKLLLFSLIARLLSILIMYVVRNYAYDESYFFIDADEWTYHHWATVFSTNLTRGIGVAYNSIKSLSFDDRGHPILLGLSYSLLGQSPLSGRILNVFLGSSSVIIVYKLAKIIYGENIARTAGIITAIFPYFLYFNAQILKEIVMIYFTLISVYYFYKSIYEKTNVLNLSIMAISIFSLFLFRVVLGAMIVLLYSSFMLIFFGKEARLSINIFISLISIIAAIFLVNSIIPEAITTSHSYYKGKFNQIEAEMHDLEKNESIITSYAKSELAPMMLAAALFAPYPSFAKIELKRFNNILFAGALVKLILMFFYYYGLYWTFMNLRERGYVISLFAIGYILMNGIAGTILQHRFQLPANPFQIMIAASGIHNMSPKFYRLWKPYLVFCFVITMAYNVFKLNIRGM